MPIINYCFISIEEECAKELLPLVSSLTAANDLGTTLSQTDPKCFALLNQFYTELMIPTFPLEDERDDIHDWLTCFRTQMMEQQHHQAGIVTETRTEAFGFGEAEMFRGRGSLKKLDVIIMVEIESIHEDETKDDNNAKYLYKRGNSTEKFVLSNTSKHNIVNIIGAATIEYFKLSKVGLIGYIALHREHRGHGLSKVMHEEALIRMEILANKYGAGTSNKSHAPLLHAIFAETNSLAAGDTTPVDCRARHEILYNLGYRLIHFPYSQPPLRKDDVNASFDDIMLLVYFPYHEDNVLYNKFDDDKLNSNELNKNRQYCSWFLDNKHENSGDGNGTSNYDSSCIVAQMNVKLLWTFVEELYQVTFIYNTDSDTYTSEGEDGDKDDEKKVLLTMPQNYCTANYYKLAHWFTHHRHNQQDCAQVCLSRPSIAPWEDIKDILLPEFEEWKLRGDQPDQPDLLVGTYSGHKRVYRSKSKCTIDEKSEVKLTSLDAPEA